MAKDSFREHSDTLVRLGDDSALELPAPRGLHVSHVELADAEYVVFSFPKPRWRLPKVLTLAESEVVHALLRGESNEEISRGRATSVRTVANQIATIFDKLNVSSRIELACRLVELGSCEIGDEDLSSTSAHFDLAPRAESLDDD